MLSMEDAISARDEAICWIPDQKIRKKNAQSTAVPCGLG